MTLAEIRKTAKEIGLRGYSRLSKGDLIRAIQTEEKNSPCFGAEWRLSCQIEDCCWRNDCLGSPDR